ncbi:hypothetical protein QCA50_008491 [Cerrena zonata]|uniref:Arf-GAP domain-containing protein n=1 Tax=Cerrena zonata TaxID=2478898 RepID=A0AAW0G5N6_9APHY
MSRQDKATTDRHSKTLRELLKRPENKFCADCKRNDPRWASWNLGVFLCIRCSGIHRSMGTHISKVKSVDLDVWTPEQMASITKWGNRLANLYWEAHLRAGHVPPDHKMDSFIRSKYESKRWAKEGSPPSDPSILDNGSSAPTSQPEPAAAPLVNAPTRGHAPSSSVSSVRAASITNRQPQPHQLLSTSMTNRPPAAQPAIAQPSQAPQQPTPQPAQATATNDLFSLDFHNPTPPAPQAQAPRKDVKQDILSLFSTPAPQAAPAYGVPQNQYAAQQPAFGQQPQNVWGAPAVAAQPQMQSQQPTSMVGQNGVGMWGVNSGWNQTPAAPAQPNLWGQPAAAPAPAMGGYGQPQAAPPQQNLFNTNDIWGSSSAAGGGAAGGANMFGSPLPGMQKKDDVFGDIWGGFK